MGLRSLGHGGLRWHALESPVREGDRRVQPADQFLIAIGPRAGVAEGVEGSSQGLVVAFEQRVDQAERHGLQAGRLRVELRDPRHQGVVPGSGLRWAWPCPHPSKLLSTICQV